MDATQSPLGPACTRRQCDGALLTEQGRQYDDGQHVATWWQCPVCGHLERNPVKPVDQPPLWGSKAL